MRNRSVPMRWKLKEWVCIQFDSSSEMEGVIESLHQRSGLHKHSLTGSCSFECFGKGKFVTDRQMYRRMTEVFLCFSVGVYVPCRDVHPQWPR